MLNQNLMRLIKLITLSLLSAVSFAQMPPPAPKSEIAQLIEKSLASEIRTPEERSRDAKERKPIQTLEFFGLQPNMNVIEIMPGAGWYTKVLGLTLAEKGKLYLAMNASRLEPRLKEWALDKVEIINDKGSMSPSGQIGSFQIDVVDFNVKNIDMVLTFRNYHNMTPASRTLVNKAVFNALKPGGIYGIIDHTRRHNEPTNIAIWRRMDPIVVIKELLDAGFEFSGYSNLHYRPDDDLRFDSQVESLKGYSDRFTLKFRKPIK
ncbi:MAG: methyltransferase [Gammaproteobacteria bacterium]|nr:methyltransferase [Gammaproteobacteria bacterium]